MTSYHVDVTREDPWWVASISGLPPQKLGATDVERFADLDLEVRDLIAGLTDTDPGGVSLTWRYIVGDQDVTAEIARLVEAQDAAEEAAQASDRARAELITELAGAGLSQRTIGDVIGRSPQRVHQLLHEYREAS